MYIKRKIDDFLKNWKDSNDKKCLIVKGPRQIGKTESIRHFAKLYKNYIEINFVEEPKYKTIISEGFKVDDIIKSISRIDPYKKFEKRETLIFFDEIQDFPEIATALKFFSIDKNYDVICSGSLLGIGYKKINSISVGYKLDYDMSSLDFEEFLWSKGYDDNLINDLLNYMNEIKPIPLSTFNTLNNLFLDFCILGGMPSVIKKYLENNNFQDTLQIQKQLILDYKEDIRKYINGLEQTKILNIYNSIIPQLSKENKKFQLSKIKNARFQTYQGSIEWLTETGIINMCNSLNLLETPLKANINYSKFKLYYFDTGLLISELDEESQDDLRANKNLGIYKGAIYENMIAESLKKQKYDLYYFSKENSTLEIDFIIRNKNEIIPIEVKSSNNKSKSLNTLINNPQYKNIKRGIKFAFANIGTNNKFITFPYFLCFLLKRYLKDD